MEVLQGVGSAAEQRTTRSFIDAFRIEVIPVSPAIGNLALRLIETYAMGHGLRALDALIAATAIVQDLPLASGNRKHFAPIVRLDYRVFQPAGKRR